MQNKYVDINADVGEGLENESQLIPYLSSCSIACGGHAGTEKTIRHCMQLAKKHKVAIGAHPSYPDPKNFGRSVLNISLPTLKKSLLEQLDLFFKIAEEENATIHHVKPHGALYNQAAKDSIIAKLLIEVFEETKRKFAIYAPWKSQTAKIAKIANWKVQFEAFGDRTYYDDLTLVSRKHPKAILTSAEECVAQITQLVIEENITTIEGTIKSIKADTICLHGDHPKVTEILPYLKEELLKKKIYIKKYYVE